LFVSKAPRLQRYFGQSVNGFLISTGLTVQPAKPVLKPVGMGGDKYVDKNVCSDNAATTVKKVIFKNH
jgi:hypothetical protein